MRTSAKCLASCIAITSIFLLGGEVKPPPKIGSSPLYALGIVTPHVEQTVEQYGRILGVGPGMQGQATNAAPDSPSVTAKMSVVGLPNFYIKIFEPVSDYGPFADHLRKFGMSVQDSQLQVQGDIQALRADLQQKGGRWTMGSPTDSWAYIDFQDKLGTTLEPINARPQLPVKALPDTKLALGTMPVTKVGIAVSDVQAAAKAYGDVFGIPTPEVKNLVDVQYPATSTLNKEAHVQTAEWSQGEIGIELIGSVGQPTFWSDFVKSHKGNSIYLVAFSVGDRLDDFRRELQAKGGRWIYSRQGGKVVDLDFTDTLGFVVELDGTQHVKSTN